MGFGKDANGQSYSKSKLRYLVDKVRELWQRSRLLYRQGLRVNLKSQRTYIVPTGFGFSFGGIALVLLAMAIGYANNLLYFFVFLLISLAITGMLATNRNVERVDIVEVLASVLFAGEKNQVGLQIRLKDRLERLGVWQIKIRFAGRTRSSLETIPSSMELDEVRSESISYLGWVPHSRGWQRLPRLVIESRFPFQMLRAWKYEDLKNELLVYPQRKGIDLLPENPGKPSGHEFYLKQSDEGLFRDFRQFQKSDSPRRIDWLRSLRHQSHLIKNFESATGKNYVCLDWDKTTFAVDFESRISQLAHWVELCQSRGEFYSLKIGSFELDYGLSATHYHECLRRLALLKPEDVV